MDAHYNIWIEKNKAVVLSSWRVQLLEAIERGGSLAKAADSMKVSARTARHKLSEMEKGLGFPLTQSAKDSSGHKVLHLTPRGQKLIEQFEALSAGLDREIAERYRAAFRSK